MVVKFSTKFSSSRVLTSTFSSVSALTRKLDLPVTCPGSSACKVNSLQRLHKNHIDSFTSQNSNSSERDQPETMGQLKKLGYFFCFKYVSNWLHLDWLLKGRFCNHQGKSPEWSGADWCDLEGTGERHFGRGLAAYGSIRVGVELETAGGVVHS